MNVDTAPQTDFRLYLNMMYDILLPISNYSERAVCIHATVNFESASLAVSISFTPSFSVPFFCFSLSLSTFPFFSLSFSSAASSLASSHFFRFKPLHSFTVPTSLGESFSHYCVSVSKPFLMPSYRIWIRTAQVRCDGGRKFAPMKNAELSLWESQHFACIPD